MLWNDISVVSQASRFALLLPLGKIFSRKNGKYTFVSQPHVVRDYKMHMGAVDHRDNANANH